jgi:ACR3 family arsenite efflux pump ArsB
VTGLSKAWLQRNQASVYAGAVVVAIAVGFALPGLGTAVEPLVNPVLAVLLYVTFLEVPFVRLRAAFRDRQFVLAALGTNFLVVPVVAFALTRFLAVETAILVGVLLVLLTPCIDYVIAFTELAGGDSEQITAITPALMLVQLLLLPAYLWLFVGSAVAGIVEIGPFLGAFLTLIALPLSLAWLTEYWADRSETGTAWQAAMGWLPVPMMALTLLAIVASQLPRVLASIGQIAAVVPVYVAFLVVMPLIGRLVADLLGMDTGQSRALVFTSVTRNSLVVLPLALALPSAYAVVPAVVVTQTLVELTGMVVLTRVVPRWLVPDDRDRSSRSGSIDD